MKIKSVVIFLSVLSCANAFADSRFGCKGQFLDVESDTSVPVVFMVRDVLPNQYKLTDPSTSLSITSPVMFDDPHTNGHVGIDREGIYRSRSVPGKDIYEFFSPKYSIYVECKRK